VDIYGFNEIAIETVTAAKVHLDAVFKWLGVFISHSSNSIAKTLYSQFTSGEIKSPADQQDGPERAFGYSHQARALTSLLKLEMTRAEGDKTDAKLKAERELREFIPKAAPDA